MLGLKTELKQNRRLREIRIRIRKDIRKEIESEEKVVKKLVKKINFIEIG